MLKKYVLKIEKMSEELANKYSDYALEMIDSELYASYEKYLRGLLQLTDFV